MTVQQKFTQGREIVLQKIYAYQSQVAKKAYTVRIFLLIYR